jgi:hypothetical protein
MFSDLGNTVAVPEIGPHLFKKTGEIFLLPCAAAGCALRFGPYA